MTGFIAKINTESGVVAWDIFDFPISQMSLFNGNYYLTEYKENCKENADKKCRVWEVNRKDLTKKKVLVEINSSNLYVVFANSSNFWLTQGSQSGGDGSGINITKYNLKGEFIENIDFFQFVASFEDEKDKKVSRLCPNVLINQYTKDQNTVFGEDFDYQKNKKPVWEAPYNNCKTVEDQQKAITDQTGKQIFQSKFPFDVENIQYTPPKPISCQKFEYKQKSLEGEYSYELLYNGEEYLNSTPNNLVEVAINCIRPLSQILTLKWAS